MGCGSSKRSDNSNPEKKQEENKRENRKGRGSIQKEKASTEEAGKKKPENEEYLEEETEEDKPVYPDVYIYWGSESGTAHGFAQTLNKESDTFGINSHLVDLKDFSPNDLLNQEYSIFILASYGSGGPTENAKEFDAWLKSNHRQQNELKTLKYSMFGCGDKAFGGTFNGMAKSVNECLINLGAHLVYEMGLGDDSEIISDDFNKWKNAMWPIFANELEAKIKQKEEELKNARLKKKKTRTKNQVIEEEAPHSNLVDTIKKVTTYQRVLDIEVIPKPPPEKMAKKGKKPKKVYDKKEYAFATQMQLNSSPIPILQMKELRKNSKKKSTYYIQLDISEHPKLAYKTAQNIALFAPNLEEYLERLATLQEYNLDEWIKWPKIKQKKGTKYPFPTPICVRDALRSYCDLTGPLVKQQLKELGSFTEDPILAEKLLLMGEIDNEDFPILMQKKKNIVDIIEEYKLKIPIQDFFQICNRNEPRYYTISSSSLVNPKIIELTAVLEHYTKNSKRITGHCSSYLEKLFKTNFDEERDPEILPIPASIKGQIRISTFAELPSLNIPMIMIATGGGIAPFIGYLQEREFLRQEKIGEEFGKMILFYGCRNKKEDFIYEDVIYSMKRKRVLDELYLAFSREKEGQKIYVQDKMRSEKDNIYELLKQNKAHLYICGGPAMSQNVIETLKQIVQECDAEIDPDQFIALLNSENRIIKEEWQ